MSKESYIPVWIALIMAAPGALSVVLTFVIALRQSANHIQTTDRINTLEQNTNGKMEALLQVTGAAEHAKGLLEGKQQDRS